MATKFGEGYYDIYPKINEAAVRAAREAITKSMGDAFAKESARMRSEDDRTTRERVNNEDKVRRTRSRNTKTTTQEETTLSNLRSKFFNKLNNEGKTSEGIFHKLATTFRTIGTVMRGLSLGAVVISGFNALRIALGGIAAVIPIVNAGLVVMPSLLAGVGAEALILKIAFRGVFDAIKDGFDPKKVKQYKEELARLAPAARTFVQEIVKLKDLKLPNLQQALFGNKSIQDTGKQLAPFVKALSGPAAGVASASGGAIGAITKELTGARGITAFTFVLKSLEQNLRAVTPGLKKFTDGFLTLIFHVSSLSNGEVGRKLSEWLGKIGDWVANIDVAKVFAKAKDAAHALGVVLKDVWDILSGIFVALNTQAAWEGFASIIHTIADFIRSGTGKLFLDQLSSALTIISGLIASLTGSALKFLAGLFAALYPAIKPLADILAKIGKDLEPLGPVIGTVLADAFNTLTGILETLEPWIKKTVGWLVDHKEDVGKVVGKLLLLVAAYLALKKATSLAEPLKPLIEGLMALPASVLIAIGFIAILAFGIYEAYKHSKTFRDGVHDLKVHLEELGKALGPLVGFFKEWGKLIGKIALMFLIADVYVLSAAVFGLTQAVEGVKRAFDNMKHWILTGWDNVQTFFTKTLPGWFKSFNDEANRIMGQIVKDLHGYWSGIINFFTGTVKGFFTKTIPSWFLALRNWAVYAYDWIVRATHQRWSAVINFFTGTVKNFFAKTVPSWFLKLRDWVVYAYDWIVRKSHSAWSAIINFFTGTVKNFFTKTIPGWFLKLRDWVVYAYDWIVRKTHSAWSEVINWFTGNVKNFFIKTIPGWANSLKNTILRIWDSVAFWTRDKWGKVKDWFNKNILNFFTKTIPGWAETLRKALLNSFTVLRNNVLFWWKKIYNTIRDIVQTVINKVWNDGLRKAWNNITKHVPLVGGQMQIESKAQIPRMAAGGLLNGPGGPKSDQIPLWASNGEFIVNAASTARYRQLLEAINNGHPGGYASGGAVSAIEALQRAVGPSLRVTSTTGGGHAAHSYHYRGMAVDFAGSQRAMDAAAANMMKFTGYILEMFHSPNWFVKNYRKSGPIDYATHFNHMHLAMTLAAAQQALKDKKSGKIHGFIGGGPGGMALDPFVNKLVQEGAMKQFDAAYKALHSVRGLGGDGDKIFNAIAKQPVDLAVKQVNEKAKEMADAAAASAAAGFGAGAPTNLGRLSGQIGSWIGSASHYANIPNSWVRGIRYIMSRESSGNPRAHNPSGASGLMQMMPGTFRAYHAKGTSSNIYDAVANIAASANYIHARWKDPYGTPWYHGGHWYNKGGMVHYKEGGLVPTLFDGGGYLPPKSMTLAANNSSNWEPVGGGLPKTIVLDLGNNRTLEFMMDDRIAKHDNEIIQYIATR